MGIARTFTLAAVLTVLAASSAVLAHAPSRPAAALNVAPASRVHDDARASDPKTSLKEARAANERLSELKATHRYLDGVTVTIGRTPRGEEAVAYYTSGEIVISESHTVSIDRILAHEIWHIIDWRDNGRMDWMENIPPNDVSALSSQSRR